MWFKYNAVPFSCLSFIIYTVLQYLSIRSFFHHLSFHFIFFYSLPTQLFILENDFFLSICHFRANVHSIYIYIYLLNFIILASTPYILRFVGGLRWRGGQTYFLSLTLLYCCCCWFYSFPPIKSVKICLANTFLLCDSNYEYVCVFVSVFFFIYNVDKTN